MFSSMWSVSDGTRNWVLILVGFNNSTKSYTRFSYVPKLCWICWNLIIICRLWIHWLRLYTENVYWWFVILVIYYSVANNIGYTYNTYFDMRNIVVSLYVMQVKQYVVLSLFWLILPVVICLSQRLSHACLSTNYSIVKPQKAQYNSYYLFDYKYSYLDNCGNSRANTCKQHEITVQTMTHVLLLD